MPKHIKNANRLNAKTGTLHKSGDIPHKSPVGRKPNNAGTVHTSDTEPIMLGPWILLPSKRDPSVCRVIWNEEELEKIGFKVSEKMRRMRK